MQFILKFRYPKPLLSTFLTILLLALNVSALGFFPKSDGSLRNQTARNIANDNLEGEDLEIRRVAVEALGTAAGTIVVMNAQNGRIYTIVNQKWGIESGFKPCSTIKLVTGIAGYKENLINPNGTLVRGSYRLGLNEALAHSNNPFFQKVGSSLGSEKMIYYASQLGLGGITGINAPNEYRGRLPFGNENLRIYSHADDFLASPLQLSVMVSAITNGGKILVPRIPKTRREKIRFKGAYRNRLPMRSSIFESVIPGMMGAVKYGTARRIKNAELNIAGKTGSCVSARTWVGLFASVAPIQNPKFSVVVITRGKYARGKYSAAIAEKIYRTLKPRYNVRFNRNLARKTITVKSAPRNIQTAAKRRKQDSKNRAVVSKRTQKNPSTPLKNTVITYKRNPDDQPNKAKTGKKKELFPTVIIDGKTEITRPRVVRNQ